MYKFAVCLLLLLTAAFKPVDAISWKDSKIIYPEEIIIKSIYIVDDKIIQSIRLTYALSSKAFSEFDGMNIDTCQKKIVEIRVVSPRIINSSNYFVRAGDATYEGRYFSAENVIYITNPFRTNILSHEIYHMYSYLCNNGLSDSEEERRAIYFESLIKQRNNFVQ